MGQTIEFMAIHDTLTLKLQENEAKFWETTIKILENFLGQTSLKSTLSLINGNCVYSYAACKDAKMQSCKTRMRNEH